MQLSLYGEGRFSFNAVAVLGFGETGRASATYGGKHAFPVVFRLILSFCVTNVLHRHFRNEASRAQHYARYDTLLFPIRDLSASTPLHYIRYSHSTTTVSYHAQELHHL
jgi:hypothetical protein